MAWTRPAPTDDAHARRHAETSSPPVATAPLAALPTAVGAPIAGFALDLAAAAGSPPPGAAPLGAPGAAASRTAVVLPPTGAAIGGAAPMLAALRNGALGGVRRAPLAGAIGGAPPAYNEAGRHEARRCNVGVADLALCLAQSHTGLKLRRGRHRAHERMLKLACQTVPRSAVTSQDKIRERPADQPFSLPLAFLSLNLSLSPAVGATAKLQAARAECSKLRQDAPASRIAHGVPTPIPPVVPVLHGGAVLDGERMTCSRRGGGGPGVAQAPCVGPTSLRRAQETSKDAALSTTKCALSPLLVIGMCPAGGCRGTGLQQKCANRIAPLGPQVSPMHLRAT